MAKKQNNGVTPQQQRILKTLSDAQMRVEKDRFWGKEPNPRDLAVITRCQKSLSAPPPKAKKPGKVVTGKVPLPELPVAERQELQQIAAGLRMEREAEIRTEILEAMRMLSIAAMPRMEAEARKGRYTVVFPLAHDRWCRASATADTNSKGKGECLPWGQDRFWLKVVQSWVLAELRRNPEARVVAFPSYRSILESLEMDTGGKSVQRIQEAVRRLSNCSWRFDFATSKSDLLAGKLQQDTRPEMVRFTLIDASRLPSRKDVERELVHGETPLPMPADSTVTKPYFLRFSEVLARTLLDPKELHIMPKALAQQASNSALTMDFWDFVLQAAKRLRSPWRVPEETLVGLFGQQWSRRRALFEALSLDLAALIEAVHPQLHAEFIVEAKAPAVGKRGNPGKTWVLVIYPLRGPIEHLPTLNRGALPPVS